MSDTSYVRARIDGHTGHLTLDRPRALNALDTGMIRELAAALDAWEHDPAVAVVLLDGAGERGFCAGGDVRALYDQVIAARHAETTTFFRAEYALDARIADYPKPVVVLADGITMGGGIGLAGHARLRVVTERSRLAMPETRIGFTPDVGGTWLLGRAPGRLGEYLALTGTTMDAADAIFAGFADRLVPSDRLPELAAALAAAPDPAAPAVDPDPAAPVAGSDPVAPAAGSDPVAPAAGSDPAAPAAGPDPAAPAAGPDPAAIVARLSVPPPPSTLASHRPWIDDAFSGDTVSEILDRLRARPEEAASATAALLEELSPTALAVALAAVRRARTLPDLRAVLAQEYGLVMWFADTQPDLLEGIRAQLVDKDRSPRWNPARIADVTPETVASAFEYRPEPALWG